MSCTYERKRTCSQEVNMGSALSAGGGAEQRARRACSPVPPPRLPWLASSSPSVRLQRLMKVELSCDEELVNADGGAGVRLICGINENISGDINHNGCGDIRRLRGRCGGGSVEKRVTIRCPLNLKK